jgi:hypothetical protein
VGHSAAALLGCKWIPSDLPAEVARTRRGVPNGVVIRSTWIGNDEVCAVNGIQCTTAARTAYDLGRRLPEVLAIVRIDALLNAAEIPISVVESIASRYPGARGIRKLRIALRLANGGAESPQETRLRLLLVRSGFPQPVTQIPVTNEWGRVVRRIDMGWPEKMVGVEYDGQLGAPPTEGRGTLHQSRRLCERHRAPGVPGQPRVEDRASQRATAPVRTTRHRAPSSPCPRQLTRRAHAS